MLQILLIRSGATEYDHQGRVQGTLDVPLSEDGYRQVETAIDALRSHSVEAIYTCPTESARQTADLIAEALGLKTKTLDKLTNLDHGLWQGMLVDDVKTKQPKVYRQWLEQPETVCPPRGETVTAVKTRAQAVLARLAKKFKSGVVALVVPEPLASVVCHVLRQDGLGNLWQSRNGALRWELIDVPPATVGVG